MHIRATGFPLLLLLASVGLTGCNDFALRKGPSPVLDPSLVETASSNQIRIIDALAADARVSVGMPDYYYRVAEAGFNYVDDECTAYFDTIFFIDRERSQFKSGLAAAGATTAAILGVTGASTLSMSVVASAFGFASAATDILAGTYLYSLPPATTLGLVNKLQIAYRDAAARTSADINTPTAAYHQIHSYLALCLPPTIETEVANQVNAATAVGVAVAGGSIAVQTGSILPPRSPIPRARLVGPGLFTSKEVRSRQISEVSGPANNPPPAAGQKDRARTSFIRQAQAALCVPETDGSLSPATELAIKDYLRGMGIPIPGRIEPFDPNLQPQLVKAINDVQNCKVLGFESAYEVGAFGVPADNRTESISQLQSTINDKLKANGSTTVVKQTGSFDTQTRDAIEELRVLRKLSPGREIDLALDKYLNSPK